MPFQVIRNDITRVEADAIVNTANPQPVVGAGTDMAIYEAAGYDALLEERKKIGDIMPGEARVTPAFALKARYIIHTVGPVYRDGNHGEEKILADCYKNALSLGDSLGCNSIAFPLISAGTYGFPEKLAIKTASSAIYDYLMENDSDMTVFLVVFDRESFTLSEKLFPEIRSYIDDAEAEYRPVKRRQRGYLKERRDASVLFEEAGQVAGALPQMAPSMNISRPKGSLKSDLESVGQSFQEYLLELIRKKDMKNADVYHGANISKQLFSKIISNKDYHPSKNTACALSIGLHLEKWEADELLEKAGMLLSGSSRFDLAVSYFLENHMYNVITDNIILFENGIEPLGMQ